MNFNTRVKLLALASVITIISSFVTRYALIALAVIILAFREDVAILALSIRHPVQPQLVIRDNYVYDPVNKLVHSFMLIEPLHDLLRLGEDKFTNLIDEMLLRLNLCDRCYVTFMVTGGRKIARVSMLDEPPFSGFRDFQANVVKVLGDYFMVRMLKGDELETIINQLQYPVSSLITVLTPPLILVPLFGALGVIPWITYAAVVVWYYISGGVMVNGGLQFMRISTRNGLMTSKVTQTDVYLLAKAFHNSVSEYALVISGNSELSSLAAREYHKASESLVVKERGKSYPGLLYWRNVIDRLTSGELPLRILLLSNSNVDHMGTVKSRIASYALWAPGEFLLSGLSHDAAVFIPLTGGRLSLANDGRVIRIGQDSLGKPVEVDLDSLPAGHMLLVGPTGMGKSWAARSILAKLIKMGIGVVVIDPHGEYLNLGLPIVDVSERFVNFTSPPNIHNVKDATLRIAQSISESFGIEDLDTLLSDLGSVIGHGDFRLVFSNAAKRTLSIELSYIYDLISSELGRRGFIEQEELLSGIILSFRSILPNPELTSFAMSQVMAYLYSMFAGRRARLSNVLVVDEAYYVMGSGLMELYVRGLRKSGLGVMLITQTLTNISATLIQNIPLVLVMGGPDSYILELMSHLRLNQSEVEWLRLGLAPHMMGSRSRALLIEGPIRRQVLVELDPSLKPISD